MNETAPSRLERNIGRVLRSGALASAATLAVGLIWKALAPASADPDAILAAGLVVLMLTPVARVILSVVEYAKQRDWAFAAIGFVVLLTLLGSLLFALH